MAIIVQKFGGTSVKSPENRKAVLNHILKAKEKGHDVVIVVSAMGRLGDPYATDTLINLLKAQGGEICPKKKDLIMSCGEIISAAVMASYIEAQGVKAEAMTGFQAGILTTADFGNAEIIKVDPSPITEKLKEGNVVVVAGFQGQTEKGEITTLGRGGSDTTAVVLGGYLKADLVEIYTDVPGIAVTDPRIIPEAPFILQISYDEVIAMADAGAKVVHPRAVRAAKEFGMALRIKSTFDEGDGTLVGLEESDLLISGITPQSGFAVAKFEREDEFSSDDIKELLKLSCDGSIYLSDAVGNIILIEEEKKGMAANLAKELKSSAEFCHDMAKVSVIYKSTINIKALTESIANLLLKNDVQIFAAASSNNCSKYIIKDKDTSKAVSIIFNEYFSNKN
ncbi:aspartate kinase [Tepidanaerobacter sp. EBM-38]|uniref:aspartate kinase n=1 Tax=Tepidanaerobacter sp. EBM-38 TaxID=1918496 RepID=UPI000B0D69C9|nr:aspartate kinase [Tepidanaerobacter sp. EBM-38]